MAGNSVLSGIAALIFLSVAVLAESRQYPRPAGTVDCSSSPLKTYDFCNWTLPVGVRLSDLLNRMEVADQLNQLDNEALAVPYLGIPNYNYWSEALHGVNSGCGTNCPTSFPAPSALGATFNMSLILAMAQAISDEARALHNEGVTGLDFWAPNININRDPRWGRNQEVPGEDPFLTGLYVENFVRGMQEGVDPRYVKVVSTCKHYAAYSLENWNGTQRYSFNAVVSDRDLVETYLPAWESCVVKGGARSIMCSYNAVNGVPSCASDFLLQTIVRDTWNFDGYVVSDCDAVSCIYNNHHYTPDPETTCQVALRAGTDNDCGGFYGQYMPSALNKSYVNAGDISQAVGRAYKQRFELGMFDPASIQYYTTIPPEVVDSPANQQLALEAARQAIVLLKNDQNTLPLKKTATIAVIGPQANVSGTLLSNYHGQRCHDGSYNCIPTPFDVIASRATATLTHGCDINSQDTSGFAAAVAAAKAADVAVLFLGIDDSIESEGKDRYTISLPGVQDQLVNAVVATGQPVVVVLINGGAVAIENIQATVPAIVEAFYGGENGAAAIADVLFGDYNPGGKLPYTIFPAAYVNQTSLFDMSMTAGPGRTYRYYTGTPLWSFGFGLSYTTFSITPEDTQLEASLERPLDVSFRVLVKNTGSVAGDEVVQIYVNQTDPDQPLRQLFGFQRVTLQPGQQTELFFAPEVSAFSRVEHDGSRVVLPGKYTVLVSNGLEEHVVAVTLTGDRPLVLAPPLRSWGKSAAA